MKSRLLAAAAATVLASAASVACAQATPAAPVAAAAGETGVLVFTPADFAASRPTNALELINRLPGFAFDGGDQVRGFAGAAGNVLVDGQRPATKSDSLSDTLSRIPIAQVERVELIRGGATGVDMQGRSVVANVIRKKADTFQQTVSVSGFVFKDTGRVIPGWNYQASRRFGGRQLDFSFGRGISMDDSVGGGTRVVRDARTGEVTTDFLNNEADGLVHSGRLTYKGPLLGGTINVNASGGVDEFKSEEDFFDVDFNERFTSRGGNERGELGLNYTRPLTSKLELETVGLYKLIFGASTGQGLSPDSRQVFEVDAEAGERIGRGVLRYAVRPNLKVEGGGEVAYNYRKQQTALTVDGVNVPLPASNVLVEELRAEAFAQGTWRPNDRWSLEAGSRFEDSTITQSGDTDQERSFFYAKPRVLATWSPTKERQLRLRVEREVGQLNFRDFSSNVNLSTDVLSAGNASLEPDKTWVYEATFEQRFWNGGALVLTLTHEDISDAIDRFPFQALVDRDRDGAPDDLNGDGVPDTRLVAGPGNIGDATVDEIELALTLPLQRFGIKGGEFKAELEFERSEVVDPTTGETRALSGRRPDEIELSFRQELPERDLIWGASYYGGWQERDYDLEEIQHVEIRHFWQAFVEYKPSEKLALLFELKNVDPYQLIIERRVFDGPRDTGSLAFVERQTRQSQVHAFVRLRRVFG